MRFLLLAVCTLGIVTVHAQDVIFSDSMENFPSGWLLGRAGSSDYWTKMGDHYHSPLYSAKCTYRSFTNDWQNTWFQRGVDLTGYTGAALMFWKWDSSMPGYDSLRFEVKGVGGWVRLWASTGFWGRDFQCETIPIPVDAESIRFRFTTQARLGTGPWRGAYVDDVTLIGYTPDVSLSMIVAPTGIVDTNAMVTPVCSTYNPTPMTVNYWVRCQIGTQYFDETYVSGHEGYSSYWVPFRIWFAGPRGEQVVRCSTMLLGDGRPENDSKQDTVTVRVHDVGCSALLFSTSYLDSGYPVTPRAVIRNHGTETEDFFTTMTIGSFYYDAKPVTGLAPGDSVVLTYASQIVTAPRGSQVAKCSTYLTTDRNPFNDRSSMDLTIRVHDVGAIVLTAPPSTIDSGQVVVPQARIWNFGTTTETFECFYRIGAVYCDTQLVTDLATRTSAYVDFTPWSAVPGSYTRACSTMLGTDLVRTNNRVTGSLLVRYFDAGVTRILAPHYRILPGSVTPLVEIRNFGNQPVTSCSVRLRIEPGGYSSTQGTSLGPGQLDTLPFAPWNASLGNYQATAVLSLADMNPENDSVSKSIEVGGVHHDVGVTQFLAPKSQIDPGDIRPEVKVFNFGSVTESNIPVVLLIENATDQILADTQNLASIAPGEERIVTFRTWLAYAGNFDVSSWTLLPSDENRNNDTCRVLVLVALHSVAPVEVLAPAGTVGRGYPIRPCVSVRNRGTVVDSFPVCMLIDRSDTTVYLDSARCKVAPGETVEVYLPEWTPQVDGSHGTIAWTALVGDYHPDDDTIWDAFSVGEPVVDVAARAIVAPSGTTPVGPVEPRVLVFNEGTVQTSFWTGLEVELAGSPVYRESVWAVSVNPDKERLVSLPEWSASAGTYQTTLWVSCLGDVNFSNDTVHGAVVVGGGGLWTEKSSLPVGERNKLVKDGGCLAGVEGHDPAIFALNGNKTPDFYGYSTPGDNWTRLSSIKPGSEEKPPGKGAAMTSDGQGFIYAAKGNNTLGFWKYDITADSWTQLTDIPEGPSRKKVKGGADLAHVPAGGSNRLFLLKGYKSEFYRFDPDSGLWHQLADAPTGSRAKWDKGSWLVYDGNQTLYAHKAKYHELWTFDVTQDSWKNDSHPGMPFIGMTGRKKKSKDGGSASMKTGVIYALKGGNTQECWSYHPQSRTWTELDTIPAVGSTGRKKRVKGGGDVLTLGAYLWATKGNNTSEFWQYPIGAALLRSGLLRDGVAGISDAQANRLELRVWPNPAHRAVNLGCVLPLGRKGLLTIYDGVGRQRWSRTVLGDRAGSRLELRTESFGSGVYFVRLTVPGSTLVRKLVVE